VIKKTNIATQISNLNLKTMKKRIIFSILFSLFQFFFVNVQTAKAQKADTIRYKTFAEAQAMVMQSYEKLMTEIPSLHSFLSEVVVKKNGFKLKTLSREGYYIEYKQKQKKGSKKSILLVYKRVFGSSKRNLILEVRRQQDEIMYLCINEQRSEATIFYELSPNKFYKETKNNNLNIWQQNSYILLNVNNL
jgi:hypothetical protein